MRAAVLALALLALPVAPGPAEAKPVQMTAAELRAYGAAALAKGYADQALQVAQALLARDPKDSAALTLQAQALRILQRLPESEAAARAAWGAATTPGARYVAATSLAQALSLQGHRLQAQYWLRQAVQNAPSQGAAAQALDDLRYVRGETPVTLRFDFGLQPSDNVNGGARVSSFDFFGITLPLPARLTALKGVGWNLGISGDWRIAADPAGETAVTFELQRAGAHLSQDVPGVSDGDFDFLHLGLGMERKGRGGSSLRFDLGRNWYGGQDLSATFGVEGVLARTLGPGTLELTLGATREARLDRASASSTQGRVALAYALRGPKGDGWRIGTNWLAAGSEEDLVTRHEAGLNLDWQAGREVAGLGLSAHLGVTGADYGSGRKEGRLSASLDAEIDRAAWLGFAPVVSLSWSRSNSNVLIYDTESLGLGLAIRSRF